MEGVQNEFQENEKTLQERLLYEYKQHQEQALDQSWRRCTRRNDGHYVQYSGNLIFSLKQNDAFIF